MLTVRLEGYNATVDQNADLCLGTWDSYGIEKIQIVPGTEWENLTITATFVTVYGSTVVVVPPNGLIGVPYEATCKSGMFLGGGRIVFSGVSEGIRRISTDICYSVKDHSPISGEEPEPTPGMWEQFVARVEDSASSVEENAKKAKTSADNALKSEENAKKSADNALKSAENVSLSEKNAQSSAASAKSSEDSAKKSAEIAYNLSQGAWEQFVDQVEESAESVKKDAEKAGEDAKNAERNAALSQSWAVGGTGTREGEDANNSKFWAGKSAESANGFVGVFDAPEALSAAYPTGTPGQIAVVLSTLSVWLWSGTASAWVDTAEHLYKATFLLDRWTGGASPYTQTVDLEPMDGGGPVSASSTLHSGPMADGTGDANANAVLISSLNRINNAESITLGDNTVTVRVPIKPVSDVPVVFRIKGAI